MPTEQILADLAKSGLSIEDMRVRALENPERAATGVPANIEGYVIPYYDVNGLPIPFYRVKAFNFEPKYKQIKGTGNHVYFPRTFKKTLMGTHEKYLIIVEGEKKAACLAKHGYPAVALGGVDSWKNRTLVLPENTKIQRVPGKDQVSIKMDNVDFGAIEAESGLALGMQNIIDLAVDKKLIVILAFDTDKDGVSFDVQRALSNLAFELRFKGIAFNKIKQLILPTNAEKTKVGIDDYIQEKGIKAFQVLLQDTLGNVKGFPQHPNVQDYISKRLSRQKLFRKEAQQVAIAVLSDLDARGQRLRNKHTDQMYYFNDETRALMDATLKRSMTDVIADTPFSRFLWKNYGIGGSDGRVLGWLATLFTSEESIGVVEPSRVLKVQNDIICYQLNDGQYIRVSGDPTQPFQICNNGSYGVLFESGMVEPMDAKEVLAEIITQRENPIPPLWPKVLEDVRLRHKGDTVKLLALLFYLSPWLQRWRGTQLPIEMAIGEPGSGKSSLYELRLDILIGRPDLRNAPNDLKDWYASISSSGGLHVTDNLAPGDKSLMQRLSDEMCRLVTEPIPQIEMRKYFTNSELMKLPIYSTFAVTAVKQPFHNADLMQRSIIIEFDKGEEILEYESRWSDLQLKRFGGRVRWLVHHLNVLHRFLKAAGANWNDRYRAKYRLINVEQALMVMAKVIGMETEWISNHLTKATLEATVEADWAFEGICEWASEVRKAQVSSGQIRKFTARDIADWAQQSDEYQQCGQLTNVRSLGRYIQAHKQMLATMAGIREGGRYANRDTYVVGNISFVSPAGIRK